MANLFLSNACATHRALYTEFSRDPELIPYWLPISFINISKVGKKNKRNNEMKVTGSYAVGNHFSACSTLKSLKIHVSEKNAYIGVLCDIHIPICVVQKPWVSPSMSSNSFISLAVGMSRYSLSVNFSTYTLGKSCKFFFSLWRLN